MKSKNTPILIAIAIPLFAVAVALSLVYFKKSNFSGLENFSYSSYIANPKNLGGNKYLLKAQPDKQLADLGDKGRLISVRSSDGAAKFAIIVPQQISANISANRRYSMVVTVDSAGRIIVQSMEKY